MPTGTSLLLRGGGLRGPTVGCFGHRIFSFADKLSQSPTGWWLFVTKTKKKNQRHTFE